MNIAEALEKAAVALANAGVADPRREAGSLLAFSIKKDKTFLIANSDRELSADDLTLYLINIDRRANREPYQYIVGTQEFYCLDFFVTPDVLIPRPETEILVEQAIGILSKKLDPFFCEIGVGSGCISVSVLKNIPMARGIAGDVSNAALEVAWSNARRHCVEGRVEFIKSDTYDSIPSIPFDVILSNPPYVPVTDLESLQVEVRDYEPVVALAGGPNGLDVIERIIKGAPGHLVDGGSLLLEIGFSQSESVNAILDTIIWGEVEFLSDLQGIPRILKAVKQPLNDRSRSAV